MPSSTRAIAVLAHACRLPDADSPEAFWHNLATGVDSVSEIPPARWSVDRFFAPLPYQPGKSISKWGAFLADIQRFDAAFFRIAADEAQVMDPQQRILLELAHETLQRSGYDDQRRAGLRIGVFLGIGQNGYSELTLPLLLSGRPTHPMLVANNIRNLIAGQIAQSLNLTGPALVLDTACSSALVALHTARQSLLAGDCDLALVGGINLNITATPFVAFSSAGVLAPSPHTYVFDERADGFVLGEGGGMILLSTLDHAVTAHAPILGVIRGSAINNDGRSLGAITPSPNGQEAVLHAAYATSGIPPESITYLEAHGTGTRIGDVVEARALTRFFSKPPASGVRYLGSVKPNVGHLLSAAGMPSLIKVLLAFHHRQLPPTLHCEQVRPALQLHQAGFTLNRTLVDWAPSAPDQPLRAGVSSFGFGGTNAHVILEAPPVLAQRHLTPSTYAFAHTPHWIKSEPAADDTVPCVPSLSPSSMALCAHCVNVNGALRPLRDGEATALRQRRSSIDSAVDDWLQQVSWKELPLSEEAKAPIYTRWLLLSAATPAAQTLAARLAAQLERLGLACTHYHCRTDDDAALAAAIVGGAANAGVLFIGSVGGIEPLHSRATLDAGLRVGVLTLHRVAQRLASLSPAQRPAGIWVVTAGAYATEQDGAAIAPERAALAGLAFALGDELPGTPCLVMDLPPVDDREVQLALLTAEMSAEPTCAVVAWRQRKGAWMRLVRQLRPALAQEAAVVPALKHKGAYIITGGAGGIGTEVAKALAAQGVPLILTGRTPLLRAPEAIALVTALRQAGATVEYVAADVTQAEEVTALFDYVCHLYGAPAGVIHAAGIVRPQPLRSKTAADVQAVLAPKVIGAWLLAQELQQRAIQPEQFVLFSSIASVLPGFSGGLSDYAAANAFLDALAASERARGMACTVLNWSIWAETGMGAQSALLHHLAAQGLAGLTSAEGVSAFYRALALDETQVVVLKPSVLATDSPATQTLVEPARTSTSAPILTTRSIDTIEQTLQSLLASVLNVEPATIAKDASFMGQGLDSMDALDLVHKLEQQGFGGLPATLFFEYQTISDLARYLADHAGSSSGEESISSSLPIQEAVPTPITIPLSPVQRAFAVHHYLYPARPAVAFLRQTLHGELDRAALQEAINHVAARHPLLRARFPTTLISAATPQQLVCPPNDPAIIPVVEVIARGVDSTTELAQLEDRLVNQPFDLETGSPWRITLARDLRQPACWHLLLAIHHIAGDAWSLKLITQELWAYYTALLQDRPLTLPAPQNSFQAYVTEQQRETTLATESQIWWRQQVAPYATALPMQLPVDLDSASSSLHEENTDSYAAHASRLTASQTAALTKLAAAHHLSLFHLLLALYLRTLQQWSRSSFLLVNVADAQRPPHLPTMMEIVGSFADTLPLGLAVAEGEPVLTLAERVRQSWLASQQHKAVSSSDLARLLTEVMPSGAASQSHTLSPLGFSFARFAATLPADCPITVVELFGRTATTTWLSLVGWEFTGALHFSWNYRTPLLRAETVATLADNFIKEVTQLVMFAQLPSGPLEIGESAGDGPANVPLSQTTFGSSPALSLRQARVTLPTNFLPVHALVQAQCQRTPDGVAVWEKGEALTYAELDRRSDQVATALYEQGIVPGDTVGLLANPSTDAVILLLGIAKAGAAWVPLDPAHPPARHAAQLQQVGTRLLLFPGELTDTAATIGRAMVDTVQRYSLDALCQQAAAAVPPLAASAEQIAYIIFTSGSTGRPKGVPITHGALANYIGWAVVTFGYSPADRVMQATSLSFDASLRQILAPLVTGGTVMPVERALLNDPTALLAFVQQHGVTTWSSVPALWARLLDEIEHRIAGGATPPPLPHLRWIQVGGEALSAQFVRRWCDLYGDQQQIVNLYGPTETTINATYYIVKERPGEGEQQIPIGYPVGGAYLQVVDEAGQPCPSDRAGELWIGGAGLSPGYLQDAMLTQARFIQTATGDRFYRSGDRVQQRPDGALLFLGRLDDQVKVRGYRIELGEIEATLGQQPGVRLAAVIARHRSDDEQELVAYLECTEPPPTEAVLRAQVRATLPDYMIPHQIYQVHRLPQMPNGKLDRQQLAAGVVDTQPLPRTETNSVPQTPTEQLLARIWQEVLGITSEGIPIGSEDDFFALGGDSLQAIRVFAELEQVRTGLPRAAYLYRYRTLTALAQAIDAYQPAANSQPIKAGTADETFGVSLAQAGFLLVRALQEQQATGWCARFFLQGSLQVEAFRQAMQLLVERHDMLRTIFPPATAGGTPGSPRIPQQRVIEPEGPLPIAFVDWQTLSHAEQEAAVAARWHAVRTRRFDPTQWPLIEMHLCRLTPQEHLWLIATDHLIGDGLSGWLLGQELLALYDALVQGRTPTLPPLRSTFRDYITVEQQREQSRDPDAEQHWRQVFATPYQPPRLRASGEQDEIRNRPATNAEWIHHSIDLDVAMVQRLEASAARAGVTPYEFLLTLFFRQVRRLTGQADLVVGSAVAGRDEPLPDIMRIFGAFATALPLRAQLHGEAWQTHLQQVTAAFAAARAHPLSPRRIAQVMHPQTPLTAAVGSQFLFSYMDFTTLGSLHSDTLRVCWERSQTELQPPSLSADLVLTGRKMEGQLRLLFTAPAPSAAKGVLTTDQMQAFVTGFQQELRQQTEPPPARPALQLTNRPLEADVESAGALSPLDTALISYLPSVAQLQTTLGATDRALDANIVRRLLFPGNQPRWLERLETPLGCSGSIVIPWFADELAAARVDELGHAVKQAIDQAAALGARCVSLAGMLPAHTRYGYALLEQGEVMPALTTGHSTTVVAVVKSVLAALAATGQTLTTLEVGSLGLGSIGSAALQLLLKVAGHPAGLTLCDGPGSTERLHALVATLRRELDYAGKVRIIEGGDTVPADLYAVDLLIGATSRPNVLEVNRLAPGTVVVDDSFPACFDVDHAIDRMTTAQDVLLVGGGLLHCGALQRTIYLPVPIPSLGERLAGQVLPDAVASCQFEALLWATQPELPLTHGVATLAHTLQYWHAAEIVGVTAASLHLRAFRLTAPLIQCVKEICAQR